MQLTFRRIDRRTFFPRQGRLVAYLRDDYWDDFQFKTLYYLTVFDETGVEHQIGNVKIGYFGQEPGTRTEIPQVFSRLEKTFFSLGQDAEYYQNIQKLDSYLKQLLLDGINDIIQDKKLLAKALKEDVTKTSLLRSVSLSSVKGQFKRLLDGGALLTEYNFKYGIKQVQSIAGLELDFHVYPESNPPTNIHVLIGRNGVGKTHLLNNMAKALVDKEKPQSAGKFSIPEPFFGNQDEQALFAGVVSVSFSAFDPFEPYPEQKDKTEGMRYCYVGLKRNSNRGGERGTPMSHNMLTNDFVKSLNACIALGKVRRWRTAIEKLESDPLFKEIDLNQSVSECDKDELENIARKSFEKMSSGHRVVLLTMTKLVENVEERTLVLMDEPEGHLHPPLLSAFVRALSDLLSDRNGVAIIATHSPVIVQEVPKSCVWKLRRTGLEANAERPEIETFGENVGILTREIFGLEVTDSGYHQLLKKALATEDRYDAIVNAFDNQLGTEAKGIIRGLLAGRDKYKE